MRQSNRRITPKNAASAPAVIVLLKEFPNGKLDVVFGDLLKNAKNGKINCRALYTAENRDIDMIDKLSESQMSNVFKIPDYYTCPVCNFVNNSDALFEGLYLSESEKNVGGKKQEQWRVRLRGRKKSSGSGVGGGVVEDAIAKVEVIVSTFFDCMANPMGKLSPTEMANREWTQEKKEQLEECRQFMLLQRLVEEAQPTHATTLARNEPGPGIETRGYRCSSKKTRASFQRPTKRDEMFEKSRTTKKS